MARVKQDLRDDLVRAGLVDRVGADLIFPTLPTAVTAYLDWYHERHGALPPGVRGITPAGGPVGTPEGPPAGLTPGRAPQGQGGHVWQSCPPGAADPEGHPAAARWCTCTVVAVRPSRIVPAGTQSGGVARAAARRSSTR